MLRTESGSGFKTETYGWQWCLSMEGRRMMLAGSPERSMIIRSKKVTVVLQTPEVDLLASRLNYQISNRLSGHLELKHQNHVC